MINERAKAILDFCFIDTKQEQWFIKDENFDLVLTGLQSDDTGMGQTGVLLGEILGIIIAPIVMSVVFFLVVTPIGIIMKIIGKDLINKKIYKDTKTYWINRKKAIGSMKRQF